MTRPLAVLAVLLVTGQLHAVVASDEGSNDPTELVCYVDDDLDGYGRAGPGFVPDDGDCWDPGESDNDTDCNDSNADIYPGAFDVPGNDFDEDCDGTVVCYIDADHDTFGGASYWETYYTATGGVAPVGVCASSAGDGFDDTGDDCDDEDTSINPGATDIPDNGVDEDCNWFDTISCVVDFDHDGYGTAAGTVTLAGDGSCDTAQGESDVAGDCLDTNPAVNPGASEVCDGYDDNCDGLVDGGDLDGDGTAAACGDLCFGEDASGDPDLDGVCADRDCAEGNPSIGLCVFVDSFENGDTLGWSKTVS